MNTPHSHERKNDFLLIPATHIPLKLVNSPLPVLSILLVQLTTEVLGTLAALQPIAPLPQGFLQDIPDGGLSKDPPPGHQTILRSSSLVASLLSNQGLLPLRFLFSSFLL